jgi:hypothetical protein
MPLRAKATDPRFANTRENVLPPHVGIADFVDEHHKSCTRDN